VTAGIRIAVQDNKILRGAVQNEIRFIVVRFVAQFTKNTDAWIRVGGGSDVFGTPGTPEPVQFYPLKITKWAAAACRRQHERQKFRERGA